MPIPGFQHQQRNTGFNFQGQGQQLLQAELGDQQNLNQIGK